MSIKICPKCSAEHQKSGTFCSRTCANSRGPRTEDFKEKVSLKLTGLTKSPDAIQNAVEGRRKNNPLWGKMTPGICFICGSHMPNNKNKTCSKLCKKEAIRRSACEQLKHGGGHKGLYKGIYCDSSYELAFLIWNLDQGNNIERSKSRYEYFYEGNKHIYIPDFIVNDIEYEIKGFMSKRALCKIEQNPSVTLVSSDEIKKYIAYVKQQYGVKDLRELYEQKEYSKSCLTCKKEFLPGKKIQKFCSKSCSGKYRFICDMPRLAPPQQHSDPKSDVLLVELLGII